MHKNRMLKLYFYFLLFLLKTQSCEKSFEYKNLWGITKTKNLCNLFSAILRHCQNFSPKLPKIVSICNACIVLFTQLWDAVFYLFEVFVLANEITMW